MGEDDTAITSRGSWFLDPNVDGVQLLAERWHQGTTPYRTICLAQPDGFRRKSSTIKNLWVSPREQDRVGLGRCLLEQDRRLETRQVYMMYTTHMLTAVAVDYGQARFVAARVLCRVHQRANVLYR